jgi:2-polyprenyl-3-methyl-5-hydroxy-6-metoxy-1,4-benzoquinol methylase
MFQEYLALLDAKSERSTQDIRDFLSTVDAEYWRRADWLAGGLTRFLASHQLTPADAIDYFLEEGNEILGRTLAFWRTGKYADSNQREVLQAHYSVEAKMRQDMISLAVSQFLWPQHYKLLCLFYDSFSSLSGSIKSYLDIGPGHGLYMAAALELAMGLERCVGVDISEFSIGMTREMLRHLVRPGALQARLECRDATKLSTDETYDFVCAGEVIANIDDPRTFLISTRKLLAPGGHLFVSTCANCPDSSHVYLFKTIQEVRDLLSDCGYVIERECVAPSASCDIDHEKRRLSISYGAVLTSA